MRIKSLLAVGVAALVMSGCIFTGGSPSK